MLYLPWPYNLIAYKIKYWLRLRAERKLYREIIEERGMEGLSRCALKRAKSILSDFGALEEQDRERKRKKRGVKCL